MNEAAIKSTPQDSAGQAIVIDEILPHKAEAIWKAITSGDIIARWLMTPTGFEARIGQRFTFKTKPAGAWDGTIDCEVLDVVPNERLAYAWKSGHADNVGYGAPLDTIVTFMLSEATGGTRLRLIHAGFVLPRNDIAYRNMGDGWKKIVPKIGDIADEAD